MASPSTTFQLTPTSALLVLCALAALAPSIRGCSPPEGGGVQPPPPFSEKVKNSDAVVWGVPKKKMDDKRFPEDNVYSVDFDLKCIYKSPDSESLPQSIRINMIGEVPGMCVGTELVVGKEAIVYLHFDGETGEYSMAFEQDLTGKQYREEILGVCGTIAAYPIGINKAKLGYSCDDLGPGADPCEEETRNNGNGDSSNGHGNGNGDSSNGHGNGNGIVPPPPGGDNIPPPNDSTDKNTNTGDSKGEGQDKNAPYESVVSAKKDDPENSGSTLTFHVGALVCLVLSVLVL